MGASLTPMGALPHPLWDPSLTPMGLLSQPPWDFLTWQVVPLVQHDPLTTMIDTPVNLQLVGSDGAGTHAVATLGGLIFDAAEARALPLSRTSLDRCVGAQLNGARFSHVARAVRLVPGTSLQKRLRREACRARDL